MPNYPLIKFLAKHVCSEEMASVQDVCASFIFLSCGFDPDNLNMVRHMCIQPQHGASHVHT